MIDTKQFIANPDKFTITISLAEFSDSIGYANYRVDDKPGMEIVSVESSDPGTKLWDEYHNTDIPSNPVQDAWNHLREVSDNLGHDDWSYE